MISLCVAALSLGVWVVLIFGRGYFWLARDRDDRETPPRPAPWPAVCAVVPARNEADVIARSIGSLLQQDYEGAFHVVLVDDDSRDGTAEAAREAARTLGREDRLTVLTGAPLAAGWTGKLWAMAQGVEVASRLAPPPQYLLLTDADIAHAPDNLAQLTARAEAGGLGLTSLMARLQCATPAERALIPAFVFFFQMLYPFSRVNNATDPLGAAAGGCMLAQREALEAQGGIGAIRGALIDDCTLGALMKRRGPIWLGLTDRAVSLRPYLTVREIGRMVARSAYAQLNYSPLLLLGVLLGMGATYLAPPLLAVFGGGLARVLGFSAWALMAVSFQPMLRFYGRSPLWGPVLPLIGALYAGFTLQSAIDVWTGRGGLWKGRVQARAGMT